MRIGPRGACAVLLSLAVIDCASVRVPLLGRPVELKTRSAGQRSTIKGELLAVSGEGLWVLEPAQAREVPLAEVDEVRVRLHGLDGRRAVTWTVAGAVLTGAALAAACSSAEGGDCGGVFAFTAINWAVFGGLSTRSLEKSSRVVIPGRELAALRAYARYPQGLPEGLDPSTLAPAAARPRPHQR